MQRTIYVATLEKTFDDQEECVRFGKFRNDDGTSVFSETTTESFEPKKKCQLQAQLPLHDPLPCPVVDPSGASVLSPPQDREEIPSLVDVAEQVDHVEERDNTEVFEWDYTDSEDLWFRCLMDAAGEAAEFFSDGIVGTGRNDQTEAEKEVPQIQDPPEKQNQGQDAPTPEKQKQGQDAPGTRLHILEESGIGGRVEDVIREPQPQEELMMLPVNKKKRDPPSSNETEGQFPLLEIIIPDTETLDS